jgi:pimeloyl-ACP methyl ester carboxylesterase
MGLSTGGLIAQHIALDHPELVEGLVLVVSGAYLSRRGRDICLRWCELAQRQQCGSCAGSWRPQRSTVPERNELAGRCASHRDRRS